MVAGTTAAQRGLRASIGRTAIWVAGAWLTASGANPLAAQLPRYDHWRRIDAVVERLGGISAALNAPPDEVKELAEQLYLRGQFYRNLFELQTEVLLRFAEVVDSAGRVQGAPIPAARYYRARALHLLDRRADAVAAYRAAAAGLPPALAPMRAAWAGSLESGGRGGWPQAFEDWRAGRPGPVPRCEEATLAACALFAALRRGDATAMYRLGQEFARRPPPDYVAAYQVDGTTQRVAFHEPAIPLLLSAADFALASRLYARIPRADAARGVALLGAGDPVAAESLLRPLVANNPSVAAYYGGAAYRLGRQAEAAAIWANVPGSAQRAVWEVRSEVAPDTAGMRRYWAGLAPAARIDPKGGFVPNLARALLRHGLPVPADSLLQAFLPPSVESTLSSAPPASSILLARARIGVAISPALGQRDKFSLALGILGTLAQELPVVQPAHAMLQRLAISRLITGEIR